MLRQRGLALAAGLALALACVPAPALPAAEPAAAAPDPEVQLGPLTREQVERLDPRFVESEATAVIDSAAARELAAVAPGAKLEVYLGTWCSDSRREVGRFWRALDEVAEAVPFTVEYVGVDRKKVEPAALLAGADVHYVPTFVVSREGVECGRVVEKAPHGIERDLADLLAGAQHGLLSATQQPGPPAAPAPPAAPTPGSASGAAAPDGATPPPTGR
ncbi:MAG TPA: hypothetical protein VFS60_02695 [Thermoanaerobaculia bacterium]|nr:hypothetical protein [Thermoanaerobaculia bacterium]